MQLLPKTVSHFMRKDYSVKIYTIYMNLLQNIHRSTVTVNTKDYPLFLFEDIVQISVNKIEKIFIKDIQYFTWKIYK